MKTHEVVLCEEIKHTKFLLRRMQKAEAILLRLQQLSPKIPTSTEMEEVYRAVSEYLEVKV